jgi:DNA polymerase (family 10)
MGKIIDACAANRVAIEINASPHRFDLDWRHVKHAKDKGVKLSLGVDAHSVEGMDDIEFGLGIARKGWLEPEDLLNCMPAEEIIAWQQSKRA